LDFLGLANHTGIFFANSPCYISSAVFNCCCHGRCKQTTLIIRDSHGRDQPTINAHDGTIPASFKVNPKSIPCWKTLRGKVTVNVLGVKPGYALTKCPGWGGLRIPTPLGLYSTCNFKQRCLNREGFDQRWTRGKAKLETRLRVRSCDLRLLRFRCCWWRILDVPSLAQSLFPFCL
jgi:hypothetical protein